MKHLILEVVSLLNIKRLQFNILNHDLVPTHTKLTDTEKEEVKSKYNILDDKQIPDISYFSPVSLVMGFRPGDLIHIKRKSRTAIETDFYRICKMYFLKWNCFNSIKFF